MVPGAFILADQVRVGQFFLLGRTARLFHGYSTWTDERGIAWAGVRRGDHCFAVTWLAAGWAFDPYACQRRAELLAVRHREMEQADGDRHDKEFARVIGYLRLGQCCERLLWAVHQQVLSARTSVFRVPDYVLADAVWGPASRPCHWRTDLLELLRGLTWLHVADWRDKEASPLGTETAVLTHAADLRGTTEDQCDEGCPGYRGHRHHHYLINVGQGFLGILEQFAQADDNGVRTYSFPTGGPKSEGPALWKAGKTGRLVSVFMPALLGAPDACAAFTARQHRLLQAVVRETTRAKRLVRKQVSEPEVYRGNLIRPFHGKKPVTCHVLREDAEHVGFNGNGKRKGHGYLLTSRGGWLAKAGHDVGDIAGFLDDLAALAGPLRLTVVGVDRATVMTLEQMRLVAGAPKGLRTLERLHLRVYTAADYVPRWTAYFLPDVAEKPPAPIPTAETAVASLLSDMRAKGISRRRLAKGIRTDPSFLSKLLSGKKHSWPQGLLEKARIWVARQKRRRQARPEKSSRSMAASATAQSPGVDLALNYLQRGWAVLPIEPGTKKPYVRWKPYQERLPTEKQVRHWFSEWPDAGIGLILGPVSGVLAVDIDGEEAYGVLLGRLGKEPRAPKILSGSAKPCRFHLFFRHPVVLTKAKHTPWHAHLEFRGHKGILVLPPSLHPSGNRYAWAEGQSCDDLALTEVPPEVLKALTPLPPKSQPRRAPPRVKLPAGLDASPRTLKFLSGVYAEGPGWNDRLFSAACDLGGRGMPAEEAEPLLLAGAKPWNVGEEELARRTIESAYSKSRDPSRL